MLRSSYFGVVILFFLSGCSLLHPVERPHVESVQNNATRSDAVAAILADVRNRGDEAVAYYAAKFDGAKLRARDFRVSANDLAAAAKRLPAAELKIDRAFVSDLETSAEARLIAGTIVQMAHTLELRVVAEGVETERQRDLLVQLGCDELQGYVFARPMSPQALAVWAMTEQGPSTLAFRDSLFVETEAMPLP